jgi:hypothetical protein
MRPTTLLGAAMTLAICALALAACGGSGGGGGNGNAGGAPDDEARLKFAECMRKHGVDVPDPQPGGGSIQLGEKSRAGDSGGPGVHSAGPLSDPQSREALEACQKELGDAAPEISAKDRQEMQDAALRFAQCMRDHGVDMPDPQFKDGPGGGGLVIQQEAGVNPDSPAFQEASEACQDKLPQPPDAPAGLGSSG